MITVMSVAYESERSVQLATVNEPISLTPSLHLDRTAKDLVVGGFEGINSFHQLVPRFWLESPRSLQKALVNSVRMGLVTLGLGGARKTNGVTAALVLR